MFVGRGQPVAAVGHIDGKFFGTFGYFRFFFGQHKFVFGIEREHIYAVSECEYELGLRPVKNVTSGKLLSARL